MGPYRYQIICHHRNNEPIPAFDLENIYNGRLAKRINLSLSKRYYYECPQYCDVAVQENNIVINIYSDNRSPRDMSSRISSFLFDYYSITVISVKNISGRQLNYYLESIRHPEGFYICGSDLELCREYIKPYSTLKLNKVDTTPFKTTRPAPVTSCFRF